MKLMANEDKYDFGAAFNRRELSKVALLAAASQMSCSLGDSYPTASQTEAEQMYPFVAVLSRGKDSQQAAPIRKEISLELPCIENSNVLILRDGASFVFFGFDFKNRESAGRREQSGIGRIARGKLNCGNGVEERIEAAVLLPQEDRVFLVSSSSLPKIIEGTFESFRKTKGKFSDEGSVLCSLPNLNYAAVPTRPRLVLAVSKNTNRLIFEFGDYAFDCSLSKPGIWTPLEGHSFCESWQGETFCRSDKGGTIYVSSATYSFTGSLPSRYRSGFLNALSPCGRFVLVRKLGLKPVNYPYAVAAVDIKLRKEIVLSIDLEELPFANPTWVDSRCFAG